MIQNFLQNQKVFLPFVVISAGFLFGIIVWQSGIPSSQLPDLQFWQFLDDSCPTNTIADDVLLVLKTGGTEASLKLPAHFETYLRCVPNFVVYSDVAQEIQGHKIHDALDEVDDGIRSNHSDFELYRNLQTYREKGGDYEELVEIGGDKHNAAWMLDKWKFFPIVEKATRHFPTAKWYIFAEADTYIVWSNILLFLEQLDPLEHWYLGGQNWIGGTMFAHGGSGYVLSSKTAQSLSEELVSSREQYVEMTENECCGDLMIAKALQNINISLTPAFPVLQGETPSTLDYSEGHWCRPVGTYHHMSSEEIKDYWAFEKDWLRSQPTGEPIVHRDAFFRFVGNSINRRRDNWDNLSRYRTFTESEGNNSDAGVPPYISSDACLASCESDKDCIQYQHRTGECRHGRVIRLGYPVPEEMVSGWMTERISDFEEGQGRCEPVWIVE